MKFINNLGLGVIIGMVIWNLGTVPGSQIIPTLTKLGTSFSIIWTIWNVGYFFRCWGKSKIE